MQLRNLACVPAGETHALLTPTCSTAAARGHVLEVATLWGHCQDASLAKIAFRSRVIRGAPVRTHSSPAAAREVPRLPLLAQGCWRCSSTWWDKEMHHDSAPHLCYPPVHDMGLLLLQRAFTLVFYIFMQLLVLTSFDDQLTASIIVLSTTRIIHNWWNLPTEPDFSPALRQKLVENKKVAV